MSIIIKLTFFNLSIIKRQKKFTYFSYCIKKKIMKIFSAWKWLFNILLVIIYLLLTFFQISLFHILFLYLSLHKIVLYICFVLFLAIFHCHFIILFSLFFITFLMLTISCFFLHPFLVSLLISFSSRFAFCCSSHGVKYRKKYKIFISYIDFYLNYHFW